MYQKLEKRYYENYLRYGAGDERSLGWSKNKQNIRFEQLLRFLNPKMGSLLDVGCGFGDLYIYLKNQQKGKIDYFGIDIMSQFIDEAVNLTEEPERFSCRDILHLGERKFDYIVMAGIFGYRIYEEEERNYAHIEQVLKKALDICNVGVSVSFLSDKTDYHTSEEDFHASPEKVLGLAYRHSRNVILDNSVMPFEFFLTIFKDDSFKKETTVFNHYFEKRGVI